MKYGVLGPLSVCSDDGVEVPIRSRLERTLLAALLVRAGQVVTVGQLVETLWGDRPPSSYASNLQTYISRLRDRLTRTTIEHANGGYRLIVPDEDLDLARFRPRGRRRPGPRDGERRRREVPRRAQPSGAGRCSPACRSRCSPPTSRTATWNASTPPRTAPTPTSPPACRSTNLLPELRQLITEHPLRERLHGLLMRALCRAGRRADALLAYQHARDLLVNELGIEPGAALQRLHQAILKGEDDEQAPTPHVPGLPTAARPGRVRRPAAGDQQDREAASAGRDRARGRRCPASPASARAPRRWSPRTRSATRSRTARSSSTWPAPRPPRATPPAHSPTSCAASASPARPSPTISARCRPPTGPSSPTGAVLVLLDDAADPAQIRPLIPGTGGSAVLVTSRRLLSGLVEARHVHLGPLTDPEAQELLAHMVGAERVARAPGSRRPHRRRLRQPSARVAHRRHPAGHPRAHRRGAGRTARRRTAPAGRAHGRRPAGARQHRVQRRRALAARPGRRSRRSARSARAASRRGWSQCSWTRVSGDAVVEELVEAGLLTPDGAGPDGEPRYRLHDLLRLYAEDLPSGERRPHGRDS